MGGRVVLVVDDEPEVRLVVRAMLERLGYVPLLARDGAEALDLLRGCAVEVAAAVIDVRMPDSDGPATLAALAAVAPGLPCAFLTGGSEYTTAALLACGARAVLDKPLRLDDLRRGLAAVLTSAAPPLGAPPLSR